MGKSVTFGRRGQPHMIVIARGDRIRHFSVRPWLVALLGALAFAGIAGHLLATGYLIMRDDLLNAALLRQARMQHAYEDRVSMLRTQVDRITSHRLLDQKFMESRIAELATRQSALAARSNSLRPLVERARSKGIGGRAAPVDRLPVPALRPESDQVALGHSPPGSGIEPNPLLGTPPGALGFAPARAVDPLATLGSVTSTLERIEQEQLERMGVLARAAHQRRNAIIEAARASGLPISSRPVPTEIEAAGGPFVPMDAMTVEQSFEDGLSELRQALDALEETRGEVTAFPIAHPAPGQKITSGFGKRRDPILGRTAFHAGIDFRAPTGTPIRAPADGAVVSAGRSGGYGKMVELDHGNGLTTRFAHLSRIDVRVGDRVPAGGRIGASGNTGRSTGPHLHYEVRSGGQAVNPMRYLEAGTRVGGHL